MSTAALRSDIDDEAAIAADPSATRPGQDPVPWDRLFEAADKALIEPALTGESAFRAFEGQRRDLMERRLGLPTRLMRGLRLAALGGPSLPSALACARWGARVTLLGFDGVQQSVTPSAAFRQFGLEEVFDGLMTGLATNTNGYDWVLAERCAMAGPDMEPALGTLRDLTARDGFVQMSYFARRGAFVETMIRALVAGIASRSGRPLPETARTLMMAKWDGQGSGRHFMAWVTGHLLDPSARLGRLIDPGEVTRKAADVGLAIRASAPSYHPPFEALPGAGGNEVARRDGHLARAALAHATGAPVYYTGHLSGAAEIGALIDAAMGAADDCCELPEDNRFQAAAAALRALGALTASRSMWLGNPKEQGVLSLITGLASACDDLAEGQIDRVQRFCTQDQAFLRLWGMPVHHAVFARDDRLLDRMPMPEYPEDKTPGRPRPE